MCDDLFDDDVPEEKAGEMLWLKTSSNLRKEGYREGIDAGKELRLQDGFNEGFSLSASTLFKIAELRGEVSGLLSLGLLRGETLDKTTESQLQDLLGDVVMYETEMLKYVKARFDKVKWLNNTSKETVKGSELNTDSPKTAVDTSEELVKGTEQHNIPGKLLNAADDINSDKETKENLKSQGCMKDKCEDSKKHDIIDDQPKHVEDKCSEGVFTDMKLHKFKDRLKELTELISHT